MTMLSDILDPAVLANEIDAGMIRSVRCGDLELFNYTEIAGHTPGTWPKEREICRGLVITSDGYVVGRPFPKYWNAGQEQAVIPNTPPVRVMDKLDGSMIQVFGYGFQRIVTTRGSFNSTQALAAKAWLDDHHPDWMPDEGYDGDLTWVFEWVAPNNQIVLRYDHADLVLLTVVDNATGRDRWDIVDGCTRFTKAQTFTIDSVEGAAAATRPDAEGYVLAWEDGTRVKVKQADYVALHAIVTNCSSLTVWRALEPENETAFDALYTGTPDEFRTWLSATISRLTMSMDSLYSAAEALYEDILEEGPSDRRAFAKLALEAGPVLSGMIFSLHDGRPEKARHAAWKTTRPEHERPYCDVTT